VSNDSGFVEKVNFQRFRWLFFGNFRDEASVIIERYSARRQLSSGPKMHTLNDLESLFRAKFCLRAGLANKD